MAAEVVCDGRSRDMELSGEEWLVSRELRGGDEGE